MGVLACADMRAGSCGQQVMTLLAARRSGACRRVVGRLGLSCGRGDGGRGPVTVRMRVPVWMLEGGGVAAGVAWLASPGVRAALRRLGIKLSHSACNIPG